MGKAQRPGLSVLESMMLVHCSRIDRLDVPARAIFSSPAVFKREALSDTRTVIERSNVRFCICNSLIHIKRNGHILGSKYRKNAVAAGAQLRALLTALLGFGDGNGIDGNHGMVKKWRR